jgi:hypothetical protein
VDKVIKAFYEGETKNAVKKKLFGVFENNK